MVVVKLPRAVTDWRVSERTVPLGQPTPFARQTAIPETVAVAKVPTLAKICVPLPVVKPIFVAKRFVDVTLVPVVFPCKIVPPTTCSVLLGTLVPIPKNAPVLI